MTLSHQDIMAGRWPQMSLPEQLANVGSEFGRSLNWKNKGNQEYFIKAFDRMLELLDLAIADKRWHNHRLKELTRLREEVSRELTDQSGQGRTDDLQKYFLQFGILARSF